MDPNGDVDQDQFFHVDLGLNYYLADQQAKLQASFTRTQFAATGKAADNLLILAAQISY